MLKIVLTAAVIVLLTFTTGCFDLLKDESHLQVAPTVQTAVSDEEVLAPEETEVDLVEQMAVKRNDYQGSLETLVGYYESIGDAVKLDQAKRELDGFLRMPHYSYLAPAESALANLAATDSIEEADALFEQAKKMYHEAFGLVVIADDGKLRLALRKFNQLIADYPSSDKIDEAAYIAGRIYEHFRDYQIAVRYYQRAFQWSETTPNPARFRAAKVLDRHLHMRQESLGLYQMALEKEPLSEVDTEYAQKRIAQLTKPKSQPEDEEKTQEQSQPEAEAESSD